jgi:predicted GH43/DUF377 family glycosyl hydrolase
VFKCPVKGDLRWEEKDVFNPAAVVKNGEIKLLYRAEDTVGKCAGTSRVGLAHSLDGYRFCREPVPVLYPDRDVFFANEKEGGCEDPRVVEAPDGSYVMTYTAFDGVLPQLFVARSEDLTRWEKKGYAFQKVAESGRFPMDFRCKSGAILCRLENGRMIAAQVDRKYWMFWGEGVIYTATSENLIDWEPVFNDDSRSSVSKKNSLSHMKWQGDPRLYALLDGRKGGFDSWLVEPGPPPVLTEEGIVLLYNGASKNLLRRPRGMRYCAGRAVLDPADPLRVVSRDADPFLVPDQPFEIEGQVGRVCFIEGLAYHRDAWFLYYGTADSKIAVAVSETL